MGTEALPQGVLLHQRRYPQQSRPRAQQDRAPQPRAAEEVLPRQRQEQAGLQVNADARASRGSGWRGTIEAVMRLSDVLPVPSSVGPRIVRVRLTNRVNESVREGICSAGSHLSPGHLL